MPIAQGVGPWFAALLQPAFMLALFQIGFLARITRSAMLDVLDQDYIRTARAKGVSEWRTIAKHAFRNTLIPVVTVIGIIFSLLIGGSVVIEQVFALPGIGRLIVQAIIDARLSGGPGHAAAARLRLRAAQPRWSTCSTPSSIRGCAMAEAAAMRRRAQRRELLAPRRRCRRCAGWCATAPS